MPTQNPRLTITLKPSTAALLRRLSELTGNSQSALIAELLEGSEVVFQRLIRVLQAAHDAKDSLTTEMQRSLDAGQSKLEAQLGLALDTMDEATKPVLEVAEKVARRRARRGPASTTRGGPSGGETAARAGAKREEPTPMSNRGVRSGGKTPKKPTRTRT